ncbi:MAG TPA: dolichyl-phosphate beta-glucosyltransferase [Patescibacteria group bacterium]|nr:dolichyl-phosphate beta-glucosyltransferase [Patescibacteria group bacterium]
MTPYLSLIIPAYNEALRIGDSLKRAAEYLADQRYNFEIIVVDDGSVDKTVQVINKLNEEVKFITLIRQPQNMGKGAAVRRGMLEAKGNYRIFTDADFSTPINEVGNALKTFDKGFDVVIGSRVLDRTMIKRPQPKHREAMGRVFSRAVQTTVFKGIDDTQCGFKGFTAAAAESIFSRAKINGFSFDVEILFLAKKLGLSIEQIPVEWHNDERSTVSSLSGLRAFLDILTIKRLHNNERF